MELDRGTLVVGVHVAVGLVFLVFAALGLLAGAALPEVGIRVLLAALVVGLGVSVSRTM